MGRAKSGVSPEKPQRHFVLSGNQLVWNRGGVGGAGSLQAVLAYRPVKHKYVT